MAQVGVWTRARAALAIEAAAAAAATSPEPSPKRRKINNNNKTSQDLKFSASSFVGQLKSIGEEETVPPALAEERCPIPVASYESPASCCSSNGSSGLDEERIQFLDLEAQTSQAERSACNCGDEIRREMSLSSELGTNSQEVESMEKPTTKTNSRRVPSTLMKMPTELELEEFFAAAEKDIQKRFTDKYNYDIVKDVPLQGRYEWVK